MKRCYKVQVQTTDVFKNTTYNSVKDEYIDVEDGVVYFVTDNPKNIYDYFGVKNVISITDIGIGSDCDYITTGRLPDRKEGTNG